MLVFVLLTMCMGGLIMLSASLFCLHNANANEAMENNMSNSKTAIGLVYDDVELPRLDERLWTDEHPESKHNTLLDFTKTSKKSNKQLPLLGLPDKAFYHIH